MVRTEYWHQTPSGNRPTDSGKAKVAIDITKPIVTKPVFGRASPRLPERLVTTAFVGGCAWSPLRAEGVAGAALAEFSAHQGNVQPSDLAQKSHWVPSGYRTLTRTPASRALPTSEPPSVIVPSGAISFRPGRPLR